MKRGVAGPESIADHMYRMGLMAMLVQGTQYDYHRRGWLGGCGRLHAMRRSVCSKSSSTHSFLLVHEVAETNSARRCMKLALVHDVAEAIVGDITPTCGVSDADKYQLEAAAVQRIKAMLGGASLAGGCSGAWQGVQNKPQLDCAQSGMPPACCTTARWLMWCSWQLAHSALRRPLTRTAALPCTRGRRGD